MAAMRVVATGHKLPAHANVREEPDEYLIELEVADFTESEITAFGQQLTVFGDQVETDGDAVFPTTPMSTRPRSSSSTGQLRSTRRGRGLSRTSCRSSTRPSKLTPRPKPAEGRSDDSNPKLRSCSR
jgi:hypothetical protein